MICFVIVKEDGLHFDLTFRRQLIGIYRIEWLFLKQRFLHFTLSPHLEDRLIWRWTNDDNFIVHSFYKLLEYGDIPNTEYQTLWKSHITLKIKNFIWLVRRNKILTKTNLSIKGWLGDITCVFFFIILRLQTFFSLIALIFGQFGTRLPLIIISNLTVNV